MSHSRGGARIDQLNQLNEKCHYLVVCFWCEVSLDVAIVVCCLLLLPNMLHAPLFA